MISIPSPGPQGQGTKEVETPKRAGPWSPSLALEALSQWVGIRTGLSEAELLSGSTAVRVK